MLGDLSFWLLVAGGASVSGFILSFMMRRTGDLHKRIDEIGASLSRHQIEVAEKYTSQSRFEKTLKDMEARITDRLARIEGKMNGHG